MYVRTYMFGMVGASRTFFLIMSINGLNGSMNGGFRHRRPSPLPINYAVSYGP